MLLKNSLPLRANSLLAAQKFPAATHVVSRKLLWLQGFDGIFRAKAGENSLLAGNLPASHRKI